MAQSIAACSNAMWDPPMRKPSNQTSASRVSQYTFARSSTAPFHPSDMISLEESSAASTSMLVNINLYLKNATVGRDISPNDTELLVLFRRNSKEITSHASQWKSDHSADWNETIPIQTSLLPKMHLEASGNTGHSIALHPKEYDIVLVALPSHSAVAVFSFDFAEMVQSQIAQEIRERSYRISPLKCRDLAATLEFHIEWEFAQYVSSNVIISAGSQTLSVRSSQAVFDNEIAGNGRPRNLSIQPPTASIVDMRPRRVSSAHLPTRPVCYLSQCSQIAESCDECKVLYQQLERRNTRLVKMETELIEAQKKVEMMGLATEEWAVREAAESRNAARYRSVAIRMLTEMEIGHCMWLQNKTHTQSTDLPNQIRYWLQELEADAPSRLSGSRNSVASTASTSSSQKSSRSVLEERIIDIDQMTELLGRARHLMDQAELLTLALDKDECSKVTSIPQQLNALEKENIELQAKVNDLQLSSKLQVEDGVCQKASCIDALEAEVEKLRIENQAYVEQVDSLSGRLYRHTETSSSSKAPSFLTKIYQDVGKAKVVLEAQLKQQKQQLAMLEAENEQLRTRLVESEPCHSLPVQDTNKIECETSLFDQTDDQLRCIECLQAMLEDREARIVSLDLQLTSSSISSASEIDSLSVQLKLSRKEANELRFQSNELERLQTHLEAIQQEKKALEIKVAAEGDLQERKQYQRMEQVREEAHESSRVAHEQAYNKIVAEKEATIAMLKQSLEALRQQQEARTEIELHAEVRMESLQRLHAEQVEGFKGQLADVSKQLKTSRQEVMELRFRNNQLESLTYKYELIVSEKNAFEAKLLALQGQLYDQRDRALSSDECCCGYESRQIHLGRMEEQLSDLQVQLGMVQERNQNQAIRIDELIVQHRRMCSEKEALNGIVDQLIAEKANFEKLLSSEQPATRSSSPSKRSQSVSEASIPCRNVADLIRNFS